MKNVLVTKGREHVLNRINRVWSLKVVAALWRGEVDRNGEFSCTFIRNKALGRLKVEEQDELLALGSSLLHI